MPIPTDTFWNIRRLNKLFAASALLLMAVIGWSIIQDYDKDWKNPQRSARVWDAAMVSEKISRDANPDKNAQIKAIDDTLAAKKAQFDKIDEQTKQLVTQIHTLESEQAKREFGLNTEKANLGVMETNLQDAMTAGDKDRQRELSQSIVAPRESVAKGAQELFDLKQEIEHRKKELATETAERDALQKEHTKLTGDRDALGKKLVSLQPDSLPAKLSAFIRTNVPLFPFPTGSERVQQVVLSDVLSEMPPLRVATVDRCMTCHVNISKKDYTKEKVISYLEEQVAAARTYAYAPRDWSKPTAPTAETPGVTALPEFWQNWGRKLLSPASLAKTNVQLKSIASAVGKTKTPVTDDKDKPVTSFEFNDKATTQPSIIPAEQLARQNAIIASAIQALYKEPADNKALATARNNAFAYPERLRTLLKTDLAPAAYTELENRYRYALIDEANIARKKSGLSALDPNPALLAHPRLDLYVDPDSKHNFESVGCTSCHDGSGQETNFVLAAHTPKRIWVDERSGEPVMAQQLVKPPIEKHPPTLASMLDAVYPATSLIPTNVSELYFNLKEHDAPETTPPGALTEIEEEAPEHSNPLAYVDPVTGKQGRAVTQFDHWIKKYEAEAGRSFELVYHEWDWPMRSAQYIQANCVRCHADPYEIKNEAPVIYEGRALFTNLGCVNCHQMDSIQRVDLPQPGADERFVLANGQRKVGTDLRHVTSKLSPAYINTWIWAPKAFRPTTKMPHFFMLENNSSDEEIRRTRQEARAITEYLVQTASPMSPLHPLPDGLHGSKDAGKQVFNSIGCLGCHSNLNDRGETWITTDLQKRAGLTADDAKAKYAGMTYNERQVYALEHLAPPEGAVESAPKYADGSPKPIFMHHGPELSGVGTKLTAQRTPEQARAWLFEWLKEPRHYSEYTVMPRLRLSDQQALDLAEYLLDQKRTSQSPDDKWEAQLTPTDPTKLREMTSLFLRSRYSVQVAYDKADDATELANLAGDALVTPDRNAKDALAYAKTLKKEQQQLVFLGKKLIGHYGCMSCHAINGAENITSPCANLSDWGQKSVDKLDFGYLDPHKVHTLPEETKLMMVQGLSTDAAHLIGGELKDPIAKPIDVAWPHVEHSRVSWITQKLKNTRVWDRGKVLLEPSDKKNADGSIADSGKPYDKLKMPTFYLSDEQVHAIATFVISNRDRNITEKLANRSNPEQLKQLAKGRAIVEAYNCVTCHQIENNTPPIQQYYKADELTEKAPPSLRGEGNKIQHTWLFNFLKNVEPLRPLLIDGIRMPSFPITDDQATAVAAYFSAASNHEAKDLHKKLDPILKYIADKKTTAAATTAPSTEPTALQPGDDWYTLPNFVTVTDELKQWALEHKQIAEVSVDPAKNKPDELAKSYKQILFKAQFVDELYNAPYPFVDTPRPDISQERFKLGESFFYEMQCLKCHVLGDPSMPGANKNPTAPNLSLAHRRLQRRWIRHWVQEPPIIQVGTKMPPFFTGLPVFALHGQPWPLSQGAAPAEIERIENIYGKTADEQTALLLDFLYAAGVRGTTGVQPASSAQPTAAATPAAKPVENPAPKPAEKPAEKPAPPKPAPAATQPAKAMGEIPAPRPESQVKADASKTSAAPVAKAESPARPAPVDKGGAGVTGKVILKGKAPEMAEINMATDAGCQNQHANPVMEEAVVVSEKNELANVVISITGVSGDFSPPKDPAVINQKGCMYSPHVVAMMVGQHLAVQNSDPFMHNVHSQAESNATFNQAQGNVTPPQDMGAQKAAETYRIKCDVHPWMNAYVAVLENPFFDVTREDGSFTISGLPAGEYKLVAWHERFGKIEKDIKVEDGKKANVDLTFAAQ